MPHTEAGRPVPTLFKMVGNVPISSDRTRRRGRAAADLPARVTRNRHAGGRARSPHRHRSGQATAPPSQELFEGRHVAGWRGRRATSPVLGWRVLPSVPLALVVGRDHEFVEAQARGFHLLTQCLLVLHDPLLDLRRVSPDHRGHRPGLDAQRHAHGAQGIRPQVELRLADAVLPLHLQRRHQLVQHLIANGRGQRHDSGRRARRPVGQDRDDWCRGRQSVRTGAPHPHRGQPATVRRQTARTAARPPLREPWADRCSTRSKLPHWPGHAERPRGRRRQRGPAARARQPGEPRRVHLRETRQGPAPPARLPVGADRREVFRSRRGPRLALAAPSRRGANLSASPDGRSTRPPVKGQPRQPGSCHVATAWQGGSRPRALPSPSRRAPPDLPEGSRRLRRPRSAAVAGSP